ncbi:MAG: hypothetical protein AUJ49_10820 [Desulfovibrionaceae bacterium CG1_02_65_16]|nr:MAG: hypothetical protein AUJ49_10820 [Desulfovibrionaceae bacterium CG1_02_65_16]
MSLRLFPRRRAATLLGGFVLALLLPAMAFAAALPAGVEQDLGELLTLSQRRAAVSPQNYDALLAYVTQMRGDGRDIIPARRLDANGTALRVTMKTSLTRLMRYCYNPAIPNYLLFPSVLRLSGWYQGSDILTRDAHPWKHLAKNDQPETLWGTEYEVNAPDSFGGGYYRYDLHRLLIITKYNGKNVLISVSKQKNRSSVGKKAVILDDGDWSYFYSGINGLNKGLIGWADTYLYDSASVQVFVEDSPHQTTFTLFKWLRAGWAGMNMVQKSHIDDGTTRYANAFKKIIESDRLPDPDELAARVHELVTMSEADLNRKIAAYAVAIENIAKTSPAMRKSEFQKVVENGKYANILTHEERVSAILVEYLKSRLGKRALVDFPASPVASSRHKG